MIARPIAVRAIDGQDVVTAAQVRSDGSFTLALPSGNRYRIEVLTAAGVKHLYTMATPACTTSRSRSASRSRRGTSA